jgi:hypothetical protein
MSERGQVQAQMPVYTLAARRLYRAEVTTAGYLFPDLEDKKSATMKRVTTAGVPGFASAAAGLLDEASQGLYPAYGAPEGRHADHLERADLPACGRCASPLVCATARRQLIRKSAAMQTLACLQARVGFEEANLARKEALAVAKKAAKEAGSQ